ncbi:hypothetical protein THAOC_29655, partial [Thalassiosira oceanica]
MAGREAKKAMKHLASMLAEKWERPHGQVAHFVKTTTRRCEWAYVQLEDASKRAGGALTVLEAILAPLIASAIQSKAEAGYLVQSRSSSSLHLGGCWGLYLGKALGDAASMMPRLILGWGSPNNVNLYWYWRRWLPRPTLDSKEERATQPVSTPKPSSQLNKLISLIASLQFGELLEVGTEDLQSFSSDSLAWPSDSGVGAQRESTGDGSARQNALAASSPGGRRGGARPSAPSGPSPLSRAIRRREDPECPTARLGVTLAFPRGAIRRLEDPARRRR